MVLNGGVVYGNASRRILLRHFGIHFGTLDCLFPKRRFGLIVLMDIPLRNSFTFFEKKFFNKGMKMQKMRIGLDINLKQWCLGDPLYS